ncbi:uncharacterized protein TRAVEDRAFT_84491, partial [Trametes versicolor FP-101664 SS1]|uniref:uncharacterized protein n=1 Tax=Trametes versicolor (strain FP-101664) TaxID=717944 RepID=UPI00046238ED
LPVLGLLLEYPIFERYSRGLHGVNAKLKEDHAEYRAPIDFELHHAQLDDFKEHHIYAKMRSIEDQHSILDGWIRSVDAYAGRHLGYLNPKGIVPQSAVIKKGEFRNNPYREKKRYDATSL